MVRLQRNVGRGFATKVGAKRLFEFYDAINDKIHSEYGPQEVYFYEYDNHECCIAWDGDLEAIKIIIGIWGADVAYRSPLLERA